MNKKLNDRQIAKYANKNSLIDAVDSLDALHQTKGTFSKRVILNVNNFGDKTHKEKFAAFYLEMADALILAEDIVAGRFKDTYYISKAPGIFNLYGGGQVSRVLTIGCKEGKYTVQVAIHQAIKQKTGAITPGEKIDAHSIQLPEFEMRKFMNMIQTYITCKYTSMLAAPAAPAAAAHTYNETPVNAPEQPVEAAAEEDYFSEFFGN